MKQVKIGRTDLVVNPIGLGTNTIGSQNIYPNISDEQGEAILKHAIISGVNFLDTAYMYGMGHSEEVIGSVVKELDNREELVIATKIGPDFKDGEMVMVNEPDFLEAEVEKALERLQIDYIDLLYIHYPDQNTPKRDAIARLQKIKETGKIKAIGVSNFSLEQLKEANMDGYIDVYQGEYNLLNRSAENDLFPYLRDKNISFIPYYPLAAGILAGKYKVDDEFHDFRASLPNFSGGKFKKNLAKVEKLREIAETKGVEAANVVLAWYLTRPEIDVLIPGAKRVEQIDNNLETNNITLTKEEIVHIDQLFKLGGMSNE